MNIVFCIPGKTFSSSWVNSWTNTIDMCRDNNIAYAVSMYYDPVVYYCRNKILGGSNTRGKSQHPWMGKLNYDYQIWIDSDMVWEPTDVLSLLNHNADIVSGVYTTANGVNLAVVENLNFNHLATYGTFQFMTANDLKLKTSPFYANYTGFGFIAIKRGVVESIEYPWFQPRWVSNSQFHDFCSEDVGFCWAIYDKGYKILVDPNIKVGHEKSTILSP